MVGTVRETVVESASSDLVQGKQNVRRGEQAHH